MDLFEKPGKNPKMRCLNCGGPLTPEEMAGFDEMIKKYIFSALYNWIGIPRGQRYVCTKCKGSQPSKFKKGILGNMRDNWYLTSALRKDDNSKKKKKKVS